MKLLLFFLLPFCAAAQSTHIPDRIDSLQMRIATLEREVEFDKWQVLRLNDISIHPLLYKLSEEDSIHISKIVWWKVMTMLYPGDGMYIMAGQNISYGWMYQWLPRRLRKRFEKANRLGKYRRPNLNP